MIRTRKTAVQRREEMIRAVLRIIGEKGIKSLTTANLAREVGLTTGAIFRHFRSLEELLQETVYVAIQDIEATFPDTSLEPIEQIMKLVSNRVQLLSKDPGLAWLLRSDEANHMLPVAAVNALQAVVQRSRKYLLNAMKEGMDRGTVRKDIDAPELIVIVMGTIQVLAGLTGIHRTQKNVENISQTKTLAALRAILSARKSKK